MTISQEEWETLPQEEKNRRIHEFKKSLRHILEGHGKEVIVSALKSILEDMKEEEPPGLILFNCNNCRFSNVDDLCDEGHTERQPGKADFAPE